MGDIGVWRLCNFLPLVTLVWLVLAADAELLHEGLVRDGGLLLYLLVVLLEQREQDLSRNAE